ncbi:DNA methyltransferase [Gordonia phage Frokostdame]|uniref:site-specific DNA-methyltransferase (cytosine-N(4)-specific) n=1 Tax=Gordonia phage Frokostdame TaxID=2250320 RepID=A0A345L357_9CAUD|nr:DNA methyltransferase [Gordonia phage Frokostdame]AXH49709.1 DNA methylase [Gordonia phage Frokostdame]
MMNPYYADDSATLYLGDALSVGRQLESGSVDCIVTSPPYFGLRDYGEPGQYGLEASPAEYVETMRALFAELRRVLTDDGTLWLNLGDSYSGSWGNQSRKEERGTQRPINGDMITPVHDGRYPSQGSNTGAIKPGAPPAKNLMGMPWRVAFALQADGWILRNEVIWAKPNSMPESITDRLSKRHEHVFMFAKSSRYWFDLDPIREQYDGDRDIARRARSGSVNKDNSSAQAWGQRPEARPPGTSPQTNGGPTGERHTATHERGRNPGDVWSIPTQPFPGAHFAVMPLTLAERCIKAGCKPRGTVLDPFSGSGTTGLAATLYGRRYVGIDLSREYLDLSIRTRLAQPTLGFGGAS